MTTVLLATPNPDRVTTRSAVSPAANDFFDATSDAVVTEAPRQDVEINATSKR